MSAGAGTTPGQRPGAPAGAGGPTERGVALTRVLASEWIKLRGLRSTGWALLAAVLAIVGGAGFTAVGILVKDTPPASEAILAEPSGGTLAGVGLAQLAVIALGVLAVTAEYRRSAIRASLTAVPARVPLVWGKATVVASATFAASLPALALAFLAADSLMAIEDLSLSLGTPGLVRAQVGAALTLAVTAVLASALGWLLRNTAGAVSVMVALLYLLPSLAVILPPAVAPYLPGNAAAAATSLRPAAESLGPWSGLAVFAGYAILALTAAALVLERRDA